MPGSTLRSTSIRKRIRYLTTTAFVLTVITALAILANGHVIHGALLMLGATILIPGSIFGRRHRVHAREAMPVPIAPAAQRRWRKAA